MLSFTLPISLCFLSQSLHALSLSGDSREGSREKVERYQVGERAEREIERESRKISGGRESRERSVGDWRMR